MDKSPRYGLRIVLVEVREKRGVSEMLETRGIVAHPVELSWEVEAGVAVAVEALVLAGVLAEVGSSVGRRRDSLLRDAGVGWSVVSRRGEGGVPNRVTTGDE